LASAGDRLAEKRPRACSYAHLGHGIASSRILEAEAYTSEDVLDLGEFAFGERFLNAAEVLFDMLFLSDAHRDNRVLNLL
jgi:hypothetical protein